LVTGRNTPQRNKNLSQQQQTSGAYWDMGGVGRTSKSYNNRKESSGKGDQTCSSKMKRNVWERGLLRREFARNDICRNIRGEQTSLHGKNFRSPEPLYSYFACAGWTFCPALGQEDPKKRSFPCRWKKRDACGGPGGCPIQFGGGENQRDTRGGRKSGRAAKRRGQRIQPAIKNISIQGTNH